MKDHERSAYEMVQCLDYLKFFFGAYPKDCQRHPETLKALGLKHLEFLWMFFWDVGVLRGVFRGGLDVSECYQNV